MINPIKWLRIPKGDYCYFGTRVESRWCPYYREFWPTDKWSNHISYCRYLDKSDCDGYSLLTDQIKCCGIKEKDYE